MMNFDEQAIEIVLDFVKKFAKKFAKKFKENKEWYHYFNDTTSFFTKNSNGDQINKQLENLFTDYRLKKLAKKMVNGNGFTFKTIIENELFDILEPFDASIDEKKIFVSNYIGCMLEDIKSKQPEIYSQYLTDELFNLVKDETIKINSIIKDLEEIKKIIKNNYNYLSIDDFDFKLKNSSNKMISLSFFESDDLDFINEFDCFLNTKTSIFVKGDNREEALYTIMYELNKKRKEAYVICSEEDWINLCKNCQLKNKVFIPFFYSDDIQNMPNNTTIYIYDKKYSSYGNDLIEINRRKYKFVIKKLIQAGYEANEANELLNKTHGFFIPLYKRICKNDSIMNKYEYNSDDLKYILCSLLIGQWTETKGDKKIVEMIIGDSYSSFISHINKYTIGGDPLIFSYTIGGKKKYFVTSAEDAWTKFADCLDSSLWNRFLDVINEVLFDIDEKHNNFLESDNVFFLSNYSDVIKEGIYNSLIVIKFVADGENKGFNVDCFISKLLNNIKNINQWVAISKHVFYISELCPSIFLNRVSIEFDNKTSTGLIDLFKIKVKSLFDENYSLNYLWALEQLLLQNVYAYKALDILFKLNDLEIKYNVSNSPENILMQVFCCWINMTCIRDKDKIDVLKKYIEKNPTNIKFALGNLPNKNTTVICNLTQPKYRISEVVTETKRDIMHDVYYGYLELCFEQMQFNKNIVLNLISDIAPFRDNVVFTNFFERLDNLFKCYDDADKYKIEIKLRDFIYDNRRFNDCSWALDEESIKIYESFLKKIRYKNSCYYYKYLFEYDFYILNPKPDLNDEEIDLNDEDLIREEEINKKVDDFKKDNCDLANLISICDSNDTVIGAYISRFTNNIYSKDDLNLIIKNQKNNNVIVDYARSVLNKDSTNYLMLVDDLIKEDCNKDVFAKILGLYQIDNEFIDLIDSINSDILKNKFWSRNINISKNTYDYDIIFDRLKTYANTSYYIKNLFHYKKKISIEKLYEYLIKIKSDDIIISFNIKYELYEILKIIKQKIQLNEEIENELANIEFKFWKILDWDEMYFFRKSIAKDGSLFSFILKNDLYKYCQEHSKYIIKNYELYDKIKFCPGVIDGVFYSDIFDKWVFDFKENLKLQKQDDLFFKIMGKLCCYSPNGVDGYPLNDYIRSFIDNNYSPEFIKSFIYAEINKREIFTYSEGDEEHEIALKYKNIANQFRKKYPNCAVIYDILYEEYESQSKTSKVKSKYEE